ncbi:PQQ-binding-like beta-propeller repeat protein [Streptomyces xiaopingdaonensis]|uniref:outer membrane protein assembly factor BamB family protein n=1 Tax=Streptomyces xiaopingdaonensis TaxID=1565415 RepID=UPI00030931F5|nr:PQQ-binding-like beta-propeller repeat protein [Streptomyces xiaopingdaonensis]
MPPHPPSPPPWPQRGPFPYAQHPSGYAGFGPPGGAPPGPPRRSGGRGRAVLLAALVTAFLLVLGGGAWFVTGLGEKDSAPKDAAPEEPTAAERLFRLKAHGHAGGVSGGWVTKRTYVVIVGVAIEGYSATKGNKKWSMPLSGPACGMTPAVGSGGVIAVAYQGSSGGCEHLVVLDLDTGQESWRTRLPEKLSQEVILGTVGDTLAVAWERGHMAYELATGNERWRERFRKGCRHGGYTGGRALVAVRDCGDGLALHDLEPSTGTSRWTYRLGGAEAVGFLSTDPLVLAAARKGSRNPDLLHVSERGELTARIRLSEEYDPGCGSLVGPMCSLLAVAGGKVFTATRPQDAEASAGHGGIAAFDLRSGEKLWEVTAGSGERLLPIRGAGEDVIALRAPTAKRGAQVVRLTGRSGRAQVLLRLPARSAKQQQRFVPEAESSGHVQYVYGRLYLRKDNIRRNPFLAMAFGRQE